MTLSAVKLDVYRTAIPMRNFEHAAAQRELAEAVVVRIELSDGRAGWGETHPRLYVTGETSDTVLADLREIIWPALTAADLRPGELPTFPDHNPSGRCINAAACAAELAVADALMGPEDWANLTVPAQAAGRAGRYLPVRVSGVVGSADPTRTARQLWCMRVFGLRDFKLKLGLAEQIDHDNLAAVQWQIGKGLARGKLTLRVDANGAWPADQTPQRVAELEQWGVCAVEQPAFCSAAELAALAVRCELPLIADESLLTASDAQVLLRAGGRIWWNIRISKNGGLARSLALAQLAAEHGVPFALGCMVGETSILSAAQRRLLAACPPPRFVEGNYGRFLLRGDLARPSLRLGYAGRLKRLRGPGLGATVDESRLARYGQLLATLQAV